MTVDCYKASLDPSASSDAAVTQDNPNSNCRGNSRFGEWLAEFCKFVVEREAGRADPMPALSVLRFPNDHTPGMKNAFPTPQFMVSDQDYARGRLGEAVSSSGYWKDKAATEWMKKSNRQNFAHADMADPKVLNAVIWFACTGNGSKVPQAAQLPAYQAMRLGIAKLDGDNETGAKKDDED